LYFKPYLTWAFYEKISEPLEIRTVEDSHMQYKVYVPAFKFIINKEVQAKDEIYLSLPKSIYEKTEFMKESWAKFGDFYNDDPVF